VVIEVVVVVGMVPYSSISSSITLVPVVLVVVVVPYC